MNIHVRIAIYAVTVVLLLAVSNRLVAQVGDRIETAPVYRKGTFWKGRVVQYMSREKGLDSTWSDLLCFVEKVTTFQNIPCYQATFVVYRDRKTGVVFMTFKNNNPLGALTQEYRFGDTTMMYCPILDFPMFLGKKWSDTCRLQEHSSEKPTTIPTAFEVVNVKDSSVKFDSLIVSTKAFVIKTTIYIERRKQYVSSQYTYLAPTATFPGSCPFLLFLEFYLNPDKGRDNSYYTVTLNDFNY